MTFTMECPECGEDIDVEATVIEGRGTEEFWGRPVSTDESECEIEQVLPCPECGRQTIHEEAALEFFWDKVYA